MAENTSPFFHNDPEASPAEIAQSIREDSPVAPIVLQQSSTHEIWSRSPQKSFSQLAREVEESIRTGSTSEKDSEVQEDVSEQNTHWIKKESATPPRRSPSRYSNQMDRTEDSSDDDEMNSLPRISQILDRNPKNEALLNLELEDTSNANDTSSEFEDDAWADDRSTYEPTDSEAESSDIGEIHSMPDTNKRKQGVPRARTAREYHQRRNAKLSTAQRRGYTWKKLRLAKLQKKVDKYIASKKSRNKPKPYLGDFNAGQFFDGKSRAEGSASTSGDDLDDGGLLQANTRQGVWEDFEAKYPHMDLIKSKTDNNNLVKAAASLGYDRVKRKENGWLLTGMECSLRNHQLRCVSWMVKRECSTEEPHGGIVADVMGLGKTVQCLGLIVANPQKPELKVKATLVIVPASLKSQWWFEINTRTPSLADTSMVYERSRIDNSVSKMGQCDIVIATYGELVRSLPQPEAQTIRSWKKTKQNISKMTLQWTKENMKDAELLHQVPWYRIIIDECHHIKNPETRLFRAALFLEGECRWLLSGTPVMNCYEEFHPLLRFSRDPLIANLAPRLFQRKYCDIDDIGSRQRLGIVLSDLIIRRTLKDKIMGFPIIKLKPTYREIREVKRYLPERLLYRAMKDYLRELINRSFKVDDERKKLSTLLPQLTRLRQLIANPDIIARQVMIVLDVEGMLALQGKLQKGKFATKAQPQRRILLSRLERWIAAKKTDAYRTVSMEDVCAICMQPDEGLLVLKKCGCKFCEACMGGDERFELQDNGDERGRCPSCGHAFNVGSDVKSFQPADVSSKAKSKSKAKKEIRKGRDARGFRPALSPEQIWPLEWLKDYDEDNYAEVLPTAKLRGTILQIEDWLKNNPSDKIIVFTQFRFFAILVGLILELKNVKFIYYTGDMPSTDRDNARRQMQTDPTVQVMIAGLKCGGTGLNFQFANLGIITDIWWNSCIDDQALGRMQRLGQEKSVYFVRIVVTKTVDSKIIELQDKKKKAIANVIQDNDLAEAELAEILGYKDGEPDEEPDTSDDEDGAYYSDDGF